MVSVTCVCVCVLLWVPPGYGGDWALEDDRMEWEVSKKKQRKVLRVEGNAWVRAWTQGFLEDLGIHRYFSSAVDEFRTAEDETIKEGGSLVEGRVSA